MINQYMYSCVIFTKTHLRDVPTGLYICTLCCIVIIDGRLLNYGCLMANAPNRNSLDQAATNSLVEATPCGSGWPA